MCKETLEMMLCLNRKELETQVVMQCAPLNRYKDFKPSDN